MKDSDKTRFDYRHVSVGTFKATEAMKENVMEALSSGQISYGRYSTEFEKRFGEIHDCSFAILSNSGTSALQVALQACKEEYDWSDGDEVIVPATTFVATPNVVYHNRMMPVFVDIETDTYGIDPTLIEAAITPKTKAIMPVHLFGRPCNMPEIMKIADKHNLIVIEDSCETMFAESAGQMVGSIGHIGCFSTYVAHLVVTGVGGISTTNDPRLASRMRSLVNHGLSIDNLNPDENFSPMPNIGRRFQFDSIGHSYRITELEAAIGLPQLDENEIEKMIRVRMKNAKHLTAGLKMVNKYTHYHAVIPADMHTKKYAWMMYPILLKRKGTGTPFDKIPMMNYLNSVGIETRDMLPILNQPAYAHLNPDNFPVSQWVIKSGFYVGCHQDLNTEDIQFINHHINTYLEKMTSGNLTD